MNHEQYEELLNYILKQHKLKKPDIPERILNQSKEHILKAYEREYKRLYTEVLNELTDNFSYGSEPSQKEVMSVIAQIEARLNEINDGVSKEVSNEIQKNYISGHVNHSVVVEQITEMAILQTYAPYSLINQYKAEQLIADTMDDLLFATQHTSKELKKVIRDVFNKHMTLSGISGANYSEIAKAIKKELTRKGFSEKLMKEGFVGIIDKSGRKWNLKTYVDMVVTTKMQQAYHEGMKDKSMETGKDLARISEKSSKTPCKYFEGMIISMTGQTEGYMTYDQLKATGMIFHPNCRHTCYPVGKIELVHPEDLAFHEKKMDGVQAGLDKYAKKK